MIWLTAFVCFIISTLFNCFYLLFLGRFKSLETEHKSQIPLSVIISAKDEAENLRRFLPKVLQQDYPNFEVIVINDGSIDETGFVLKDLQSHYKNLSVISLKASVGKKEALTKAIKTATHEYIIFTDADCVPASALWLASMGKHFNNTKHVVLGYGGYMAKPWFLNKLIRYETLITALQYFGFANLGSPYMGVGRNLAYTKSVFMSSGGFKTHMHISSGDDDLFISEAATAKNTAVNLDPNGFTYSLPKTSFRAWFHQKRRHITTSKHYKLKHQVLLSGFFISTVLFWGLTVTLLTSGINIELVLLLLLIRETIHVATIFNVSRKLKEPGLLWYAPILEISLLIVQACLFMTNIVSKPKHWR